MATEKVLVPGHIEGPRFWSQRISSRLATEEGLAHDHRGSLAWPHRRVSCLTTQKSLAHDHRE